VNILIYPVLDRTVRTGQDERSHATTCRNAATISTVGNQFRSPNRGATQ
jgi:hypothetical protein